MTNFWDTKAPCAKYQAAPDGLTTAVTMAPATKPPKCAHAILRGGVPHVTYQSAPVTLTVMGVARVLLPRVTMTQTSPNVTAPKGGWAQLASFRANLGLRLVIISACAICAITGLPVTCCAPTIVRFVWMGSVIADLRVGEDSTARGKDVLATRKIARGMANA